MLTASTFMIGRSPEDEDEDEEDDLDFLGRGHKEYQSTLPTIDIVYILSYPIAPRIRRLAGF